MHKADHARRRTKEVAAVDGVLGIDIAKAKFEVALLRPDRRIRRKSCANTPEGFADLARWLARQAVTRVHAALEATGHLRRGPRRGSSRCRTRGERAEPGHHACVCRQSAQTGEDRSDRRRADGAVHRNATSARVDAGAARGARAAGVDSAPRCVAGHAHPGSQSVGRGISVEAVQTSITTVLTTLDAEITAVQQQIRGHVGRHPGLRAQRDLLTSIPGIGEATAALLIAELFDKPSTSARQAAAFAGLVPRIAESGTGRTRGRLVKRGPGRLRKALYFPALAALRCNPTLRALRLRMRAAGKPPMVIVGAAMRKLIHLAFGVLKSGRAYDPTYAQP
jgi:transposase